MVKPVSLFGISGFSISCCALGNLFAQKGWVGSPLLYPEMLWVSIRRAGPDLSLEPPVCKWINLVHWDRPLPCKIRLRATLPYSSFGALAGGPATLDACLAKDAEVCQSSLSTALQLQDDSEVANFISYPDQPLRDDSNQDAKWALVCT